MRKSNGSFPDRPEVVIVGAGPAGMFLAYLLVTNGVSVRVLERHTDFQREFRGEGIQPSVMAVLEQLGFLSYLMRQGIAVPAHRAEIYLDEEPVVTLSGLEGATEDFGLILFQEGFLAFLDEQCRKYPHYQLDMGFSVTEPILENGRVAAVKGRRKGAAEEIVEGEFFVITSGRNTALRRKVDIGVEVLESPFNIYWLKMDPPSDPRLVPDGFRAYLQDDAMFIFYRTYDQRIQIAWGKRDWNPGEFKDVEGLKKRLLSEIPSSYRSLAEEQFGEDTERQLLNVTTDRMKRWHLPGILFLGDAAHTMSPVAGQGINLAVRDSIVAANYLIEAHRDGRPWDEDLMRKIEAERRPEVEALQDFQIKLGRLMLGAPRWQTRLVFRHLMPVLSALGIRQRYVRQVQGGIKEVRVRYPVLFSEEKGG